MIFPFITFQRSSDRVLGVWLEFGSNQWFPWFAEIKISVLWVEATMGIRYKSFF